MFLIISKALESILLRIIDIVVGFATGDCQNWYVMEAMKHEGIKTTFKTCMGEFCHAESVIYLAPHIHYLSEWNRNNDFGG